MHGEVIRRDNCKEPRKDHLYPQVAQRRGMQRGKEEWKKPYFLRVADCVTGYVKYQAQHLARVGSLLCTGNVG